MLRPRTLLSCQRHGAVLAVLGALSGPASGSEALMDLFKLLHDKGTLSAEEYELLVNAARADEEKEAYRHASTRDEVRTQVARVDRAAEGLAWAERIRLKGDLRTRYQYQDEDGVAERSRGRLRYRLGVIARPVDRWEVGGGIASGNGDQRSTNQSFDETFSAKSLNLDYAYMQHDFGNGLKGIAGKFPFAGYLYAPTDLMWDTDINPEGLSVGYSGANGWGTWFANGGVWVLEEEGASSDDPYMGYGQFGQSWSAGGWTATLAATLYGFGDIDAIAAITRAEGTNTDPALGSVSIGGEIGHAFGGGQARLLAEYVHNYETDTGEDTAWALGAKYAVGKWGMKYVYADIDANAVPDFLPDSDRYDGLTDVYGHEFEITYALLEKVILGLDVYGMTDDPSGADQVIVQADLNVKF